MAKHCEDIEADRKIGQYWERQFCLMAAEFDKSFTPMQIGHKESIVAFSRNNEKWNRYTLPDVTIWTAPGEHHEIKHKNPTRGGLFGLEVYRFNALLWFAQETRQPVLYTIHNHDLAGGRDNEINDLAHWLTINILDLNDKWIGEPRYGKSWINGKPENTKTYFWPVRLWQSLGDYWTIPVMSQIELL